MKWPWTREKKPEFVIVTDGVDFAVRRRDGKFLDMKTSMMFWHAKGDRYFNDCWSTKEAATRACARMNT